MPWVGLLWGRFAWVCIGAWVCLGLGFGSGCLGLGIGFGLPWGLSVYLGAWICLETCCGLSPTMGFILGLGWITLE